MTKRNVVLPAAAFAALLAAGPAAGGQVARMVLTPAGLQSNGTATSMTARSVSADGRFVAFHSNATNLVAGDTNGLNDIFVRDRVAGTTERVNLTTANLQASANSSNAAISADGTTVAWESSATNLVPGDTNAVSDVFVRDRPSATTSRVSVATDGTQANGASTLGALSGDGRVVVFRSTASNLVPGDTNAQADVFVRDRATGETTRVSVASDGTQANGPSTNPAISDDGALVAFESTASNLVAGDTNGASDVFVHDRATGTTARISVDAAGGEVAGSSTTPVLSGDGRFVAFRSTAAALVAGDTNGQADVFVYDRLTGAVVRASVGAGGVQANGASAMPALSADGTLVAFQSSATNLVPGDTNGQADVFVRDLLAGETARIDLGPGGVQANGVSSAPALSADGTVVVFTSTASNLVPDDTVAAAEVFAWAPVCSDGVLDAGETCDDGNLVDGDGCDANCTPTGCGNGIVTAGEDCDDGNLVDGDGCNATCTDVGCGNGRVEPGEACDDGNLVDGDGCDANCTPTACGNGLVTAGETCDDGNLVDGDGCDANCTPTACGNGVVTAGEACDDGNLVDGDGCDGDCTPSLCVGGVVMRDATLTFEHLGRVSGDERLELRGTLPFPPGMPPAWQPSARGVQVLIEDLGQEDPVLVDMTRAVGAVPPAGTADVCQSRRDGWRTRGAGRVQMYRSHGVPGESTCGGSPVRGVLTLRFNDKRARGGGLEMTLTLRGVALDPPVGPLRARVVLGGGDEGLRGECGSVYFASCSSDSAGAWAVCR
jgi:cysteine-rich repeat protein